MEIYTIGHSIHTQDKFIDILAFAEIEGLVDVRAFPGSRKHPQFSKDKMLNWLPEAGFEYTHLSLLGGRRRQSERVQSDLNAAWNNQSFHNYADYTLTDDFQTGIDRLVQIASNKRIACCCSERHPSRCHRLLISNWLTAHGWHVKHIIEGNKNQTELISHQLGQWDAMPIIESDGTVVYPKV